MLKAENPKAEISNKMLYSEEVLQLQKKVEEIIYNLTRFIYGRDNRTRLLGC